MIDWRRSHVRRKPFAISYQILKINAEKEIGKRVRRDVSCAFSIGKEVV